MRCEHPWCWRRARFEARDRMNPTLRGQLIAVMEQAQRRADELARLGGTVSDETFAAAGAALDQATAAVTEAEVDVAARTHRVCARHLTAEQRVLAVQQGLL